MENLFYLQVLKTMLYNSNFDDTSLNKLNLREFNKTIDDPCAIQRRNGDNDKKLKFVTTNHIDLLQAKDKLNFFGMTMKDQLFVPSDNIDQDSFLRYGKTGGIITNEKTKSEFGQLPLSTIPSQYQLAHGNLKLEDDLRLSKQETNRQSINPRDSTFYNRSFYIFDDVKGIDTPNPLLSIEGVKQFGPRGGVNSRFVKKQK
jgi:hypothetical protein